MAWQHVTYHCSSASAEVALEIEEQLVQLHGHATCVVYHCIKRLVVAVCTLWMLVSC